MAIEIEGSAGPGEGGHDQIQVTGSSTLDGTLSITTGGVYADPTTRAVRDTFTLIASAGGSTGAFATVSTMARLCRLISTVRTVRSGIMSTMVCSGISIMTRTMSV